MRNCLQLQLILLLLLVAVCAAQTKKREIIYSILGEGEKILGKTGAEFTSISSQECAARCLADEKCVGYKNQHNGTLPINCLLIHCLDTDQHGFESDETGITFEKVLKNEPRGSWAPPVCWPESEAALYLKFDNPEGLIFMEEWTRNNSVPLVPGKVNKAVRLLRTKRQWVDLGIHTEACMTRPETCDSGGAISLWVRPVGYWSWGGFISSQIDGYSGSVMFSASFGFHYRVKILDGEFKSDYYHRPTGWTHVVLNYIGPNDGEGIRIYVNGVQVASDNMKIAVAYQSGDGRIVVGRYYTDSNRLYTSVEVDELIFFNRSLTLEEIKYLST